MGISKIGTLYASNADAILKQRQSQAQDTTQQQKSGAGGTQTDRAQTSDAVVLSQTMRTNSQQSSAAADQSRTERVQKLKEQVRNGTYRPDSEKVAVAVMKELA